MTLVLAIETSINNKIYVRQLEFFSQIDIIT